MSDQNPNPGVLIVDDKPEAIDILNVTLRKDGYRILTARSGQEALSVIRDQLPDVVLLDMTMPGANGLEVCKALKADERTEDVVVIFLSALSDTSTKTAGLSVGAADYIEKPYNPSELRARVRAHLRIKSRLDMLRQQYLDLSRQLDETSLGDSRRLDGACVRAESKLIVFESDIARVHGVVHQLLAGIEGTIAPKLRNDLFLGLHEMVLNAIEHGNFGISSTEKSTALERQSFQNLLEERRADPTLAQRQVRIEYSFDGASVSYAIEDQGDGFDWRSVLAREEPEDILASNGRGILISRYIFDRISYNEKGNRVELAKSLSDA